MNYKGKKQQLTTNAPSIKTDGTRTREGVIVIMANLQAASASMAAFTAITTVSGVEAVDINRTAAGVAATQIRTAGSTVKRRKIDASKLIKYFVLLLSLL